MPNFMRAANIVLGVVNVALFVFWLSLIRIDIVARPPGADQYALELLSFQISVLEAVMAFLAVILATLGFFGYQLVIERAEARADKAVREAFARLKEEAARGTGTPSGAGGLPAPQNVSTQTPVEEDV